MSETPSPTPRKAAANPRELAVTRKRQVVAASVVAFGATVALVMTHPLASDAAGSTPTAAPQPAGQAGQAGQARRGEPAPGGTTTNPAQPAPTFFAQPPAQTSRGTAPQIQSGGTRSGTVRSRGS